MRVLRALLIAVGLAVASGPAWSQEAAAPTADDPALDRQVMKIAEILRCLVCQNQTIADSHADLAVDLRNQIREKLKAGMTEQQIVDFMTARYGDFVLYNPPMKASTWLLWFGPFMLLLSGVGVLYLKLRKRAVRRAADTVSEADHRRAVALLEAGEKRDGG